MTDYRITSVVFCDDVRKEVTGKDILIGAYGGGIMIPGVPVHIPITLWVEMVPNFAGHFELDLRAIIPGNPAELKVRMVMEIQQPNEPSSFFTPQALCMIGEYGDIEVSVKATDEEEWRMIAKKSVRQGTAPPPTIPQIIFGSPPGQPTETSTVSPPPFEQSPSDAQGTKLSPSRRRPSSRRTGRTPAKE